MKAMPLVHSVTMAAILSPGLCAAMTSTSSEQAVISHLYGLRPSHKQCLEIASGASAPMRSCMTGELDYQNRRLKRAYRLLMAKLNPTLQEKLKAEESIWIQYMDNRCAAIVDGLERPELESLSCKVDETEKQTIDLEARLFVL